MEKHLVIFELANEHYAVEISTVESIVKLQTVTPVPQAPSFVEGITNLRGSVLPVIDLRKRFGLAEAPVTEAQDDGSKKGDGEKRIVVVTLDGIKVGMIVDAVSEVLRVPEEAVEPPPSMVASINASFITGIAKVAQRLIILLDLARVLSVQEKAQVQSLEAAVAIPG